MPLHLAEKTGTLTLHFQPHPDSEGKPGKARALVLEVEAAECERPEGCGSPQILALTIETLERLLGLPLHLQIDPDRRILYVYVQRPATVNGPGTMEEDAAEFEKGLRGDGAVPPYGMGTYPASTSAGTGPETEEQRRMRMTNACVREKEDEAKLEKAYANDPLYPGGPRRSELTERTTPFEHETTAPAPEAEGLSFPVDISKSGDQTFPEPCGTSKADEEFLSGGPLGREPRPAQ